MTGSTTLRHWPERQQGLRWVWAPAVARESADVVLIGDDLNKFVQTVRTARRCRSTIYQNFYGTLAADAAGTGLASIGFLKPLLAAFIHLTSQVTFILNSTRLLAFASPPSTGQQVALASEQVNVNQRAA